MAGGLSQRTQQRGTCDGAELFRCSTYDRASVTLPDFTWYNGKVTTCSEVEGSPSSLRGAHVRWEYTTKPHVQPKPQDQNTTTTKDLCHDSNVHIPQHV